MWLLCILLISLNTTKNSHLNEIFQNNHWFHALNTCTRFKIRIPKKLNQDSTFYLSHCKYYTAEAINAKQVKLDKEKVAWQPLLNSFFILFFFLPFARRKLPIAFWCNLQDLRKTLSITYYAKSRLLLKSFKVRTFPLSSVVGSLNLSWLSIYPCFLNRWQQFARFII